MNRQLVRPEFGAWPFEAVAAYLAHNPIRSQPDKARESEIALTFAVNGCFKVF